MAHTIAVFCGRDYGPNKSFYENLALQTGSLLAQNGYITTTGGGPGMMSDVNKGAMDAGGKVISVQFGFNDTIQSPYFTEKHHFEDLSERKKFLIGLAQGMIVLPGGVGTLHEAVEVLSMKRIAKIPLETPLIFIGKKYFDPLKLFLKNIEREKFIWYTVDAATTFVDTPKEAISFLKTFFTSS